ncbi:unnamed protein product, partial [Prorocentrum cordatum]
MSPRFACASSVAVLLASHHACGFEQGVDQHVPREQSAPRLGFLDCTGQSDLTDRGIRRAYRRIAKAKHPDKQRRGHLSVAPAEADPPEEESEGAGTIEDFTELRDSWLQDPLRFHIYRAVFDRDGGRLTEFGDAVTRKEHSQKSAPAVLQTLRARIERVRDSTPSRGTDKDADTADRNNTSAPFASEKDDLASTTSVAAQRQAQETEKDWPYLDVEIDVRNSGAPNGGFLPQGGSWTFAFARKGVSTVHYRGDEKAGGYDVCCDFLKDSKCVRNTGIQHTKGADGKLRSSESPGPRSPQVQASSQNGSLPYQTSDCPFARDRETLTFRVRKPLHKDLGGQWGGAVQVFNERREEVLCVALALQAGPPHLQHTASLLLRLGLAVVLRALPRRERARDSETGIETGRERPEPREAPPRASGRARRRASASSRRAASARTAPTSWRGPWMATAGATARAPAGSSRATPARASTGRSAGQSACRGRGAGSTRRTAQRVVPAVHALQQAAEDRGSADRDVREGGGGDPGALAAEHKCRRAVSSSAAACVCSGSLCLARRRTPAPADVAREPGARSPGAAAERGARSAEGPTALLLGTPGAERVATTGRS